MGPPAQQDPAGPAESFIYPRRVLVIRAGPRPRRYALVLLSRRTAASIDHVLASFASAVCMQSGCIRQLVGVNTASRVIIIIFSTLGRYIPEGV